LFRLSIALFLLIVAATAQAVEGEEVRIFSESLRIAEQSGTVEFEGKVRIEIRGAAVVCDHLIVRTSENDPSDVLSGTATGGVVVERGEDRVQADEAHLDLVADTVELTGSPSLSRGQTVISARKIVYRLDEGTATFLGPVMATFPETREQ
jgi:lipopolysaccharide export system protein LptA